MSLLRDESGSDAGRLVKMERDPPPRFDFTLPMAPETLEIAVEANLSPAPRDVAFGGGGNGAQMRMDVQDFPLQKPTMENEHIAYQNPASLSRRSLRRHKGVGHMELDDVAAEGKSVEIDDFAMWKGVGYESADAIDEWAANVGGLEPSTLRSPKGKAKMCVEFDGSVPGFRGLNTGRLNSRAQRPPMVWSQGANISARFGKDYSRDSTAVPKPFDLDMGTDGRVWDASLGDSNGLPQTSMFPFQSSVPHAASPGFTPSSHKLHHKQREWIEETEDLGSIPTRSSTNVQAGHQLMSLRELCRPRGILASSKFSVDVLKSRSTMQSNSLEFKKTPSKPSSASASLLRPRASHLQNVAGARKVASAQEVQPKIKIVPHRPKSLLPTFQSPNSNSHRPTKIHPVPVELSTCEVEILQPYASKKLESAVSYQSSLKDLMSSEEESLKFTGLDDSPSQGPFHTNWFASVKQITGTEKQQLSKLQEIRPSTDLYKYMPQPFTPSKFQTWITTNLSATRTQFKLPKPSPDDEVQKLMFEFLDAFTEKRTVEYEAEAVTLLRSTDAWLRRNSIGASERQKIWLDQDATRRGLAAQKTKVQPKRIRQTRIDTVLEEGREEMARIKSVAKVDAQEVVIARELEFRRNSWKAANSGHMESEREVYADEQVLTKTEKMMAWTSESPCNRLEEIDARGRESEIEDDIDEQMLSATEKSLQEKRLRLQREEENDRQQRTSKRFNFPEKEVAEFQRNQDGDSAELNQSYDLKTSKVGPSIEIDGETGVNGEDEMEIDEAAEEDLGVSEDMDEELSPVVEKRRGEMEEIARHGPATFVREGGVKHAKVPAQDQETEVQQGKRRRKSRKPKNKPGNEEKLRLWHLAKAIGNPVDLVKDEPSRDQEHQADEQIVEDDSTEAMDDDDEASDQIKGNKRQNDDPPLQKRSRKKRRLLRNMKLQSEVKSEEGKPRDLETVESERMQVAKMNDGKHTTPCPSFKSEVLTVAAEGGARSSGFVVERRGGREVIVIDDD